MTKKEFRKKLKNEKDISYKLIMSGTILSSIALFLIFITYIFDQNTLLFKFPTQIICYFVCAIIALIGLCLDIVGEVKSTKKYREHLIGEKKNA